MVFYRGEQPNFGDELNLWLWPKLLPNFFDHNEEFMFLGIGSIISNHYKAEAKKIIFGSGYVSGYFDKPDVSGSDWDVFFVRGPRTAQVLNLPPSYGIGDAAILVRSVIRERRAHSNKISFIPHWQSLDHGNWQDVCALSGITLIDPRWPVDTVLKELLESKVVIAEAMHGAIVADALRIPWIPVLPVQSYHRGKWFDWAESLDINLKPYRLWPSTLQEANHALTHRPILSKIKEYIESNAYLNKVTAKAVVYKAAMCLTHIARQTPMLSDEKKLDQSVEAMLIKLQELKDKYHK